MRHCGIGLIKKFKKLVAAVCVVAHHHAKSSCQSYVTTYIKCEKYWLNFSPLKSEEVALVTNIRCDPCQPQSHHINLNNVKGNNDDDDDDEIRPFYLLLVGKRDGR